MKALVRKESNIALYLFSDSETVTVSGDKTVIGDPETLIIADCTTENVTLFEGVDEPSEWDWLQVSLHRRWWLGIKPRLCCT